MRQKTPAIYKSLLIQVINSFGQIMNRKKHKKQSQEKIKRLRSDIFVSGCEEMIIVT